MKNTNTENGNFGKWLKYQFRRKRNFKLFLSRVMAGSIGKQLIMSFSIFLIAFILVWALYGFNCENLKKAYVDMVSPVSLRNSTYETLQPYAFGKQVTLHHNSTNYWRYWIAYLTGTIVFSGVLIATITNVFRSWGERFKNGVMQFSFHRHVVFLGYNDMVPGMIEKLCGDEYYPEGVRIVVGVPDQVQETYMKIKNCLSKRQRKCVVVMKADICNTDDLKRLNVHKTVDVYIIGTQDDAYNLNSYEKIHGLCKRDHHPNCYVQMRYQSTFALFQRYQENKDNLEHFHAFNFPDSWARKMFKDCNGIDNRKNGAINLNPNSDKQFHLVIVGMTEMGEALAREAAFICHYPNYVTKNIRSRITFIDPQAKNQMNNFTGKYNHLFDLCHYSYREFSNNDKNYKPTDNGLPDYLDIEFEFIQANIADKTVQKEFSTWALDEKQILTIAICTNSPQHSLAAGLYLPDEIFDPSKEIPVWIYQPVKGSIIKYLKDTSCRFENAVTFGTTGKDLDIKNNEMIEQAKRLNHFYRHYEKNDVTYDEDAVEDDWKATKVFEKWSNIYNVSAIATKLRSIGGVENLSDAEKNKNNIELISEVEHNRSNVEKLMMGFRPTTDLEKMKISRDDNSKMYIKQLYKEQRFAHDDIRPFNDLDNHIKDVNRYFTKEIPQIISI